MSNHPPLPSGLVLTLFYICQHSRPIVQPLQAFQSTSSLFVRPARARARCVISQCNASCRNFTVRQLSHSKLAFTSFKTGVGITGFLHHVGHEMCHLDYVTPHLPTDGFCAALPATLRKVTFCMSSCPHHHKTTGKVVLRDALLWCSFFPAFLDKHCRCLD